MFDIQSISYYIQNKCLLDNICSSFSKGLFGIIGPNGAGKTSLLKILSGIISPTSGKVFFHGKNLFDQDRRKMSQLISLIPQNISSNFAFTAFEIVLMGRYPYHTKPTSQDYFLAEQALKKTNTFHLKDLSFFQLSQGEKKLIYIARTLVTNAKIMLLDEPTASLDIKHQMEIWTLLEKIKKEHIILIATHSLSLARRFCDNIMLLHQGKLLGFGKSDEILSKNNLTKLFGTSCCHSLELFS